MDPLLTVFASIETLIRAPVSQASYRAAVTFADLFEAPLHEVVSAQRELDEQLRGNPTECRQMLKSLFTAHVRVRPRAVDAELHRSLFARFLAIAQKLGRPLQFEALYAAIAAENTFWHEMHECSRPHKDVAGFVDRISSAAIIPIARTDARVQTGKTRRYESDFSQDLTEQYVLSILGAFTESSIVFERQSPCNVQAWDDATVGISAEERRDAVFVGCSVDDMRAAEAAGCNRRIFVDRTGEFTALPKKATHLVRSLGAAADLITA